MALINHIIPFLIYFETGVRDSGADCATLFEKARRKGVASDPDDLGGDTLVGITAATYKEYCRRKGKVAAPLQQLTYPQWLDILKTMFWDRWQADLIDSQPVAEMLVDWVWTSGKYGITLPQKILGVTADGIVGRETLRAVACSDPVQLLSELKNERIAYIERICVSRPANRKFRNGWLRRINACARQQINS